MTEVYIPFNSWSRVRLKDGIKSATTRTSRYGAPGDIFEVDGVMYELVKVEMTRLQDVAKNHYEAEGCMTRAEFIEVWCGIHPLSQWTPEKKVFIHFFRVLE